MPSTRKQGTGKVSVSKEMQKKLKDIMSDARHDSIRYEPNEGIDHFFDRMRSGGYLKSDAETLFAFNREYIEGDSGQRMKFPKDWKPQKK